MQGGHGVSRWIQNYVTTIEGSSEGRAGRDLPAFPTPDLVTSTEYPTTTIVSMPFLSGATFVGSS